MENRKATRVFEIRAAQGEAFVLAGRALSYNEISSNELCPGVREQIMPGCFRASLASGKPVFAFVNHNETSLPLGRSDKGTLVISDSNASLDFRVQLDPNNSYHRDVFAAVRRQDICEMSFGFICLDEDFVSGTYNGESCQVRCVRQAELLEVSVVNQPFYGDGATAVSARAAAAGKATVTDEQRKQKAAAIGKLVAADRRAMDQAEVSSMEDWASARLSAHFASKGTGWRVVHFNSTHVFAMPADAFDNDTDCEAMAKCSRFVYGIDKDGNVALSDQQRFADYYPDEENPDGPDENSARFQAVVAELRDRAVWKRRMRATAGIFTR